MQTEFWVRVKAVASKYRKGELSAGPIQASKQKPNTTADQIAVKISLEIPDSYFQKPQLIVKISLPEPTTMPQVTYEVQDGIADIIEKQLGLKVHISADEPSEKTNED